MNKINTKARQLRLSDGHVGLVDYYKLIHCILLFSFFQANLADDYYENMGYLFAVYMCLIGTFFMYLIVQKNHLGIVIGYITV